MVVTPNQFKKGTKIEVDNEPYSVVDYLHIKMGRGGANVRTKMKSLISGSVIERTFKSDEKIKQPDFEEKTMQYLYNDTENYYFMDNESYKQISMNSDDIGEISLLMPENLMVSILIYNQEPIGVELPNFVELEVTHTDPGLKGDTVGNTTKPATVSTGASIQVPLFVAQGNYIKIDTRTNTYIERVKAPE